MTSTIEWIILFTVITIAVLYIRSQLCAPNLDKFITQNKKNLQKNSQWIKLEEFFEKADNGDLIFMCGDTHGERTCRWITGSMFSHVGFLFKQKEGTNNVLYIFDADLGQRSKNGPRIMRLDVKLKRYHGYRYIMWRQLGSHLQINESDVFDNTSVDFRPSTENIGRVVEHIKNFEFDNKMLTWLSLNFIGSTSLYNFFKDYNKMFCSELVAFILQFDGIDILKKNKKPAWYSPKSFTENIIDSMDQNYSYGPHIYCKF